ncbi:TPA: hypothetical protein ACPZN9_002187 [Yersinia enterocolitica]|uniref:hypothetical protein n=1 Tax=Yersinia TaxID=629 RepID=UPI000A8E82AF|nr:MULTISPECIES: hypothetical protein [Yersinia]HDL8253629.1 hypothetical protein [Yersinia enterocolitica]
MLLKNRDDVYQKAKAQRPERWSGRTRNCHPVGKVTLNPEREKRQPKATGVANYLDTYRRPWHYI